MPWTAADAKSKRNDLTDEEASVWARVANGALTSCIDKGGDVAACEVSAIKQAHAVINKLRKSKESTDMPKYSIENMRETVQPCMQVVEGSLNDEKMEFDICIILAGRSANQTIYSEINLTEIAGFINTESTEDIKNRSKKMYTDHVRVKDSEPYPGRSLREWAATIVKAWIPEDRTNMLFGHIKVTPQCAWIYELAKDSDHELGVSIHVSAIIERAKDAGDGKPGVIIKQVVSLYSVDFVTEAAAGGRVLREESKDTAVKLIKQAYDIANKRNDTVLCSIIESVEALYMPTDDDRIAINANTKTIKPFNISLKNQQKEEDAKQVWWVLCDYLRELIFLVDEVGLDERTTAGKGAIEHSFKVVDGLIGSEEAESLHQLHDKIKGGDSVYTTSQQHVQSEILQDLKNKGIFNKLELPNKNVVEIIKNVIKNKHGDKQSTEVN